MDDRIQSLDRLERLARLLDEGKLTRDEYEELKHEIIGSFGSTRLADSGVREDRPASENRATAADGPLRDEPKSLRMRVPAPPSETEGRPLKDAATRSGRELTEEEIWFSYTGRIGAGQYWGRFVLLLAGTVILIFAGADLFADLFQTSDGTDRVVLSVMLGLILLFNVWVSSALAWKRLHDRNQPGVIFLLILIPLAGPIIWLAFSVMDGTPGPNTYGPRTGSRYATGSPSLGNWIKRVVIAAASEQDLRRLSRARERNVRMLVALQPKTNEETLRILAEDSDPEVAREAQRRLTLRHLSPMDGT